MSDAQSPAPAQGKLFKAFTLVCVPTIGFLSGMLYSTHRINDKYYTIAKPSVSFTDRDGQHHDKIPDYIDEAVHLMTGQAADGMTALLIDMHSSFGEEAVKESIARSGVLSTKPPSEYDPPDPGKF